MSRQTNRLADGGLIRRDRPLRFRFDGREYQGFEGDTLASALLANGVRILGRSFKYHRPRGLMAAGAEEPNALVTVGVGAQATPNLKATEVPLREGLDARAVNCWPNAGRDVGGAISALSRFMPAGFYYKTFMLPHWRWYEGTIRNAAGLGRTPDAADPDSYEHAHAHADVLVVGAGPAGLAAALAAGRSGARVLLCHSGPRAGGGLMSGPAEIDGMAAQDWADAAWAELGRMPEVTLLADTTAFGYYDDRLITLLQRVGGAAGPRERLWQVRARRVILATGGHERPMIFPGNDRPGIMLAGAVRRYLHRFGVVAGQRAVIVTNNDTAYATAFDLLARIPVAAIIDSRADVPAPLRAEAERRGIELLTGAAILSTRGDRGLSGVTVLRADGARQRIACDLLAMSGGWSPAVHLFAQAGGQLRYDEAQAMLRPSSIVAETSCVGLADGAATLAASLTQGHEAGVAASRALGFADSGIAMPRAPSTDAPTIAGSWLPHPAAEGKAWVDFQNDVTVDDVALAVRENFISVEHLKRYTTLGMAVDQGKTSNVNGLAILAELTGRDIAATGTTRFRPPYTPVTVGAFAGRQTGHRMRGLRRTVLDGRHNAAGAVMRDYGGWSRPACYPRSGEGEADAVRREALTVRRAAGLFDASPLGKIEVKGRDAGKFLDRMYVNSMSRLGVGRVRYGLMLNEFGVIIDDGVTARIADNHFLVGTTSGGADRIAEWMEEWRQCEWPDLDLVILPVTAAWSTLTLTGPDAPRILAGVGSDLPPFPHMSWRQGIVGGAAARVARVSYTGETSFEISVAPAAAPALWDAFRAAGAEPFGVEALMVLRTEKGFLHVGGDTDGTTLPGDVGWGPVIAKKSGDFVGRRSLTLPSALRPGRLRLVGIEPVEPGRSLPVGAHLVAANGDGGSQGYITSACDSPVLGRSVGLAMLADGQDRLGQEVRVAAETPFAARIVTACFYDPEGERLNG